MKECNNACDTSSCFLCRQCVTDWLPAIGIHKKNFELKRGERIFTEEAPVAGIYFVFKGTVKVHKRWDAEKELIIRFAGPGDMIGHLGLGREPLYPVSATALEAVTVCYISREFFESTLRVNAQLTYNLMYFFANELQESQRSMRNLAHMSVKARIAQAFILLKEQFGSRDDGSVNLDITRQDLASFAGASYETLFKVVNEFTAANLVELAGRNIWIRNEDALSAIIKQDNLKNVG